MSNLFHEWIKGKSSQKGDTAQVKTALTYMSLKHGAR